MSVIITSQVLALHCIISLLESLFYENKQTVNKSHKREEGWVSAGSQSMWTETKVEKQTMSYNIQTNRRGTPHGRTRTRV